MSNESPARALTVVVIVALVCSVLVSVAVVSLRPVQQRNQLVERNRNIVALSGLAESGVKLTADEVLAAVEQIEVRVLDIDSGRFVDDIEAAEFNPRAAVNDPDLGVAIPSEQDVANLGRRSRYEIVYLVKDGDRLSRLILPIVGQGMWSTIYGYLALEADLNTIASVTFYEQAETAGLGDKITDPAWQQKWVGRSLFGSDGSIRFRVASGTVDPASVLAQYQVDAISGATVTGNAVGRIIQYWFGPHGYSTFLGVLGDRQAANIAVTAEQAE